MNFVHKYRLSDNELKNPALKRVCKSANNKS